MIEQISHQSFGVISDLWITYTRRERRGLSVELPVYPRGAVGVKSPLPFTVPDFRAR